jgi:hypothetical protein
VSGIRAAFWIAGVVLLAALLVLSAHLAGNTLEFSQYNAGWNGTSQFFSGLDRHHATMISSPSQLAAYRKNALLLIIAPQRNPTSQETAAYRAFLEQGNTIVLADDFGSGSRILRGIGSRILILEGNLSSIDREYADSYTVAAYRVTNESPVRSVSTLLLNRPAPLEGGTPLVMTSIMSWVDANGDRRINSDEMMGKFAVIAKDEIGSGELVVISDPSIFINSMQEPGGTWDNQYLVRDLTTRDGPLLVDQMNSRTRDAEGMSEILHVTKTILPVQVMFLGVLVLAVAVAWRKRLL